VRAAPTQAYPVLRRGEHPVQGTVYRLVAVMRYGRRVARLQRELVFGSRQATRQFQFGGPRPPQSSSDIPWLELMASLAVALAVVGCVAVSRRRIAR
jgi:hypothetical protein